MALGGSLTFLSSPALVSADDLSDSQARLQIINRLKRTLQDHLQRAQAQEISLQQQLQQTHDLISQTVNRIADLESRIADLERQIAALESRIAETRLKLAQAKADYGAFMRATYESNANPLALLLGAPNFQAFLDRAVTIEHVNFLGKQLMDGIRKTERELQNEQDLVKQRRREADEQRAQLLQQRVALEQQQAQMQVLLIQLRASIRGVGIELVQINGQSAALAQQIADMEIARQDRLIAEAEQAAWQQAQFWMQHNLLTLPVTSGTHSTHYPLIWPLQQGTITQPFGPSSYPYEPPGFGYAHFHTGIDIAYAQGTPVLAADDGVVVAAAASLSGGQPVGYGNYVIIAHRNAFFSLYGHMLAFQVQPGETVHQGQVIGLVGSTGNSTGAHLHFEYRYGGQPQNPLPYLPPNGPNGFNQ